MKKEDTKKVVIKHYEKYNRKRFSTPWVCQMTEYGKHDFTQKVGTYSNVPGEEGDLVVFNPVEGQVYGYGRKDYKGKRTEKNYAIWNGAEFVECDKLGRIRRKENEI